jgi:hypothetical protein
MPQDEVEERLSEQRRRAIFLAPVEAQDQGVPVPQSRRAIAERFDLRAAQLRAIEREGLENDWPPL